MSIEPQKSLDTGCVSRTLESTDSGIVHSHCSPIVSLEELNLLSIDCSTLNNYTLFSKSELYKLQKEVSSLLSMELQEYDYSGTKINEFVLSGKCSNVGRGQYQKARELVDQFFQQVEEDELYVECLQAYQANDQRALKELLPEIFVDVIPLKSNEPLLHGVTFLETDSVDSYVNRILQVRSEGLFPTPYGEGTHCSMDRNIRPIFGAFVPEETHGVVYFLLPLSGGGNAYSPNGSSSYEEGTFFTPRYTSEMKIGMRPDCAWILGDYPGEMTSAIWNSIREGLISNGIKLVA